MSSGGLGEPTRAPEPHSEVDPSGLLEGLQPGSACDITCLLGVAQGGGQVPAVQEGGEVAKGSGKREWEVVFASDHGR